MMRRLSYILLLASAIATPALAAPQVRGDLLLGDVTARVELAQRGNNQGHNVQQRNRGNEGTRNRQSGNRDYNRNDERRDRGWDQNNQRGNRDWNHDDRRDDHQAYQRRGNDNDWNRRDRRADNNWRRDWRNDRRYDWRSYRNTNRGYYRPGRYYAPYRNHRYSRFNIGISLGSGFFGQNYWINDPWQYRLPPAYGPYRWVRYYGDVILVDVRTGYVADVIYDFFW